MQKRRQKNKVGKSAFSTKIKTLPGTKKNIALETKKKESA
jgi:hypothetical protein